MLVNSAASQCPQISTAFAPANKKREASRPPPLSLATTLILLLALVEIASMPSLVVVVFPALSILGLKFAVDASEWTRTTTSTAMPPCVCVAHDRIHLLVSRCHKHLHVTHIRLPRLVRTNPTVQVRPYIARMACDTKHRWPSVTFCPNVQSTLDLTFVLAPATMNMIQS